MMNINSGWQGAAGIMKMKVTKATSTMPSAPPAGDDGPRLNLRGLTWEPVMLTGMRARMATMRMRMRMRRKKHRKPMMDHRRMWKTDGIVDDVDGHECDDADADAEE
jgi:hypothetical protein